LISSNTRTSSGFAGFYFKEKKGKKLFNFVTCTQVVSKEDDTNPTLQNVELGHHQGCASLEKPVIRV
jgi:hypothetical protein